MSLMVSTSQICPGTLSIFQNGQRLATLKDGSSGDYCWCATLQGTATTSPISIERGLARETGEQDGWQLEQRAAPSPVGRGPHETTTVVPRTHPAGTELAGGGKRAPHAVATKAFDVGARGRPPVVPPRRSAGVPSPRTPPRRTAADVGRAPPQDGPDPPGPRPPPPPRCCANRATTPCRVPEVDGRGGAVSDSTSVEPDSPAARAPRSSVGSRALHRLILRPGAVPPGIESWCTLALPPVPGPGPFLPPASLALPAPGEGSGGEAEDDVAAEIREGRLRHLFIVSGAAQNLIVRSDRTKRRYGYDATIAELLT
ncbi:hypothetical protein THAOC_29996 [Thalassiosira oceanica]|uniref:Uncharacterized protein n=1 Tax=Thalassiosira oceanica TaxID=159749 RepID=K0RCF1_THAOC|nr:hypothetical protein THAOC_29996 [Thalassiosira oceanica]|eukprot:EJK50890.1 hypothetical protein THAOC_29996 [Thalassiosira oceanica]